MELVKHRGEEKLRSREMIRAGFGSMKGETFKASLQEKPTARKLKES